MKKLVFALFAALSFVGLAEDHTAALIVQNHSGVELGASLQQLADVLAIKARGQGLSIINPQNSIIPEADAINLARLQGADALLSASVISVDKETVREGEVYRFVASVVLNLQDVETKRSLAGSDVEVVSDNFTAKQMKNNQSLVFSRVMKKVANDSAKQLIADLDSVDWTKKAALASVNFTCNIQGAYVKIDGVSYGTVPSTIKLREGLHKVEVAYIFHTPFAENAYLADGQNYNVVLQINEEGRARYQDDVKFAEIMDRIRKTGATDDEVRLTLARGTAKFWENSGVKADHAIIKNLLLDPPGNGQGVQRAPTVDELFRELDRKGAPKSASPDLSSLNLDDDAYDWCTCANPGCTDTMTINGANSSGFCSFVCANCAKVNRAYARKAVDYSKRIGAAGGRTVWLGENAAERAHAGAR